MKQISPRFIHRYAVFTALATLFLLFAGGMVTSTDSGLAVPDWPLAYGMWFPPMVGGIFYEHGHRMTAGVVGILIFGLAFLLAAGKRPAWIKRLGFIAVGCVIVQALLGGLTVILLLPPEVSVAHAMLGNTVFCLVTAIAYGTSPSWGALPKMEVPKARFLHKFTMHGSILAVIQLLLGAIVRHSGWGVMVHMAVGLILLLSAVPLCLNVFGGEGMPGRIRLTAGLLAGGLVVQVALGFAAWKHVTLPLLVTAHVVVGSLIVCQFVMLAWMARTFLALPPGPRGESLAASPAPQGASS